MNKIKMSIIIPTYNKLGQLRIVLKSLESQVTKDIEVIIVFDGCKTSVIEEFTQYSFSFKPVIIICKENGGRAVARNKGIEVAKGDIITFVDDDRVASLNFIAEHLRLHENVRKPAAVLGARYDVFFDSTLIRKFGEDFSGALTLLEEQAVYCPYPYVRGKKNLFRWINFFTGNVSVNRKLIEKVKGFDENFKSWGGEDNDLGIRLAINGAEYYYSEEAINYHLSHESNYQDASQSLDHNMQYMKRKFWHHPIVLWGLIIMHHDIKKHSTYMNETLLARYKESKMKENQANETV
jgi:GT2 family glycosyltransferase